jgi:peptide/nickel transport system permease protein
VQRYLLRRLILLIPVLLFVGFVSFNLVHLTPGDPAAYLLGDDATTEAIEDLRERMGLTDPYHVQFLRWSGNAIRGDLGRSLYSDEPVTSMVVRRLEPTLLLTFASLLVALTFGVPAGTIMAVKRNSTLDQGLLVVSLFGLAMPNFWLGINLILLFSVTLGWLPVAGYAWVSEDPMATLRYLIMPALALGVSQAALIARITRTSMLEVLNQDYIRTARAKGVPENRVRLSHALRNAWIPIVTVIGSVLATLLSGAIVVEIIFRIPGIGQLMITSIQRRDYAVIQGLIMFIAFMYVFLNLLIDILYVQLDPRIRLTE